MPKDQDPKWEVVSELPGERKRPAGNRSATSHPLRNGLLWTGVGIGVILVLILPVLRALAIGLFRAWWLWVGLAIYWIWRRAQRTR